MTNLRQFEAVNPHLSLAAVHDRMVVFARDTAGRLAHVDNVSRGKACQCRCLACDEPMIARQGEIKAHSFAHESGSECQYAIDAMLNWLAKELIAARLYFRTPPLTVCVSDDGPLASIKRCETIPSKWVRVESVRIDTRILPRCPSVVMLIKGRELILELTHADRLGAVKRAAVEKLAVPAVEIRLAHCQYDTVDQFERILFGDLQNKHWLFNPKEIEMRARLRVAVDEQLRAQNILHEHQRQEQALAAAAEIERERERELKRAEQQQAHTQQQRMHLEQLRVHAEQMRIQTEHAQVAQQERERLEHLAQAVRQRSMETHRQTLHYRTADGGLLMLHDAGDQVLIVPETGKEQALEILARLGLAWDAERRGYPTSTTRLPDIMVALLPHVKSVRSV